MTTRSGSGFKAAEMSSGESAVADLIRVLLEDRQRQEDERARREERMQQETQEQLALERERQDAPASDANGTDAGAADDDEGLDGEEPSER